EYHCVAVVYGRGPDKGFALDLATRDRYPHLDTHASSRAADAWDAFQKHPPRPRVLWLPGGPPRDADKAASYCWLNRDTGEVEVSGVVPGWLRFTPLADGRPVLKGAVVLQAQCRGHTLALLCSHAAGGPGFGPVLRLYQGP